MKNARGAGRKPVINEEQLNAVKNRIQSGESITSIAREYGISRQSLYNRLKEKEYRYVTFEYVIDGDVTTIIEADFTNESVRINNIGTRLSKYAFGINQKPTWEDFNSFLENQVMQINNTSHENCKHILFQDVREDNFSIYDAISDNDNGIRIIGDTDVKDSIRRFEFTKKDILYSRTDTDGYQLKALSRDRLFFVKSQAIISGKLMNDWAVELIASDICEQLSIPCVKQYECEFVYGDHLYKGVCSDNFELDGYTFISFERLIERIGLSSKDSEFIQLGAIDKMKWCAEKLSVAGNISYEKTLKYMLDFAVIDCLIGNIDRRTKNFGLFFNSFSGEYEIPLIFDNGMGLFENDGYRDNYSSYDAAMMNVYVAPYGEDPFDMMKMLMNEYDISGLYPGINRLNYKSLVNTQNAHTYMKRMKELCQRLD